MNSYVLKGTFKLQVGDEIKETPVDSMMFVPRGVAQNFMNVAPGLVSFWVGVMPGGFEWNSKSFRTISHLVPTVR